jgi:type IV secretory pathway VirB4 component
MLVQSRRLLFRMQPALISSLPLGLDHVRLARCLPTSVLAATFPFTGNDLHTEGGLLYGINPHAKSPVILDRFALPNHNAVIFATSGAGKSYLVKLELIRAILTGTRAVVIDPEGEYAGIVASLGGQVVTVQPGKPVGVNPFALDDVGDGAVSARITSLLTLFELLGGGLSANQRAAAEEALSFVYASNGYSDEAARPSGNAPTLNEVHSALTRRMDRWTPAVRGEIQELAARLQRYVSGSGSWLFAPATSRPSSSPEVVAYVLAGLPEEDRAAAMFLVLDRVWASLRPEASPQLVVVDEAWWLMQYPDTARFVQRLAKTARKRHAGLTLITQDVTDVLANPIGEAVVTNAAVQVLMRQASQAIPRLAELFQLTRAEQSWLLNAQRGEGLLLASGKRVPFKAISSEVEAQLIEGRLARPDQEAA